MSDSWTRTKEVFNRLTAIGIAISEEMQVALLLASFEGKSRSLFGHVVATVQSSQFVLSWETATARLLQENEEKAWRSGVLQRQGSGSIMTLTAISGRVAQPLAVGSERRLEELKFEDGEGQVLKLQLSRSHSSQLLQKAEKLVSFARALPRARRRVG